VILAPWEVGVWGWATPLILVPWEVGVWWWATPLILVPWEVGVWWMVQLFTYLCTNVSVFRDSICQSTSVWCEEGGASSNTPTPTYGVPVYPSDTPHPHWETGGRGTGPPDLHSAIICIKASYRFVYHFIYTSYLRIAGRCCKIKQKLRQKLKVLLKFYFIVTWQIRKNYTLFVII